MIVIYSALAFFCFGFSVYEHISRRRRIVAVLSVYGLLPGNLRSLYGR